MSPARTADVVVVGGGAAGALAALAAAGAGARVELVRRAYGATALSSGCVDLGTDPRRLPGDGFAAPRRPPLSARLSVLARLHPTHPLSVIGCDAAVAGDAVALLRTHVPFLAELAPDGPTHVVGTAAGTWKETGTAAASIVRGDLLAAAASGAGARVAIVGFQGAPWTDPAPIARGLAAALAAEGVALDLAAVAVDWPARAAATPDECFTLARALDDPAEAERLGVAIALAVAAWAARPTLLLLPPLIGLDRAPEAIAAVQRAAGAPCAELAAAPPSVPGLRLQRALDRAVARAGIVVTASDARGVIEPGALARVGAVLAGDASITCGALVLATGKYLGGGISKDPGRPFVEPVLGLRVSDGAGRDPAVDPEQWTQRNYLTEHAVFTYGVRVDAALRPLDAGGAPALANVRCAGSVLAGYAAATDGAAMGTAVVTGVRAGRLAASGAA